MFNFTTTNVINTDKDITTGKALWAFHDEDGDKPAVFSVRRVGNFVKDNVTSIHKAVANDPINAKLTIDFSTIKALVKDSMVDWPEEGDPIKGMSFRLAIYLGLTQASQDSRYSNDLIKKGKPISIDFTWLDDAATTVDELAKNIKKYQVMVYGDKLLDVTADGTCLTIDALNEFQRFVNVSVDQFLPLRLHGLGEYVPMKSLSDIDEVGDVTSLDGTTEGYYVGKEGFGTFSYILRNLRIPTEARTAVFAQNADETPIYGAKYTQYTIHYCTKRGSLGLNAVGHQVMSMTTHVFFVKEDLASDFESALEGIAPSDGIVSVPATA